MYIYIAHMRTREGLHRNTHMYVQVIETNMTEEMVCISVDHCCRVFLNDTFINSGFCWSSEDLGSYDNIHMYMYMYMYIEVCTSANRDTSSGPNSIEACT